MDGQGPKYYGKYRGRVTNNQDDKKQGRLKVKVPDILGDKESGWAMPAVPYAGKNVGLYLVPPKDANVWIEFEHGDSKKPIWTGCFWAEGESPVPSNVSKEDAASLKILKTNVATVTLDNRPNSSSITIETTKGMKIVINSQEIEINNGQNATVKLNGNTVSINGNALEVT
jgi:uncharacterized protein involved in type VI secretion and phage assembly